VIVLNVFGQDKTRDKIFSIGIGLGNENNVSNYGLFYSGDFKLELKNRLYLNPRVEYFQSTGSYENAESYGDRYHHGLFLDCGASYSFVKKQNFEISINLGPSLEIGKELFLRSRSVHNGVVVDEVYENNNLFRLGGYADLEFSFYLKNVVNTIGIKSYAFGIYPEFLGIIYKIGLKK